MVVGRSNVTVATAVDNVGSVDAVETVLIFATAPLDNVIRYWKRLVGFTKVLVKAVGSSVVHITVPVDELAVYTYVLVFRARTHCACGARERSCEGMARPCGGDTLLC